MTKEELSKENAELLGRLASVSIALCNVLKCAKELVKSGYLEKGIDVIDCEEYFYDLVKKHGFRKSRAALRCFLSRLENGKAYDERGNEVEDRFNYMKACLESGIRRLENEELEEN